MKATLRIPMKEPYAYIELEAAGDDSFEDVYTTYQNAMSVVNGGSAGLSEKDFAKVLCEYAQTGAIVDGGNYEFSDAQKVLMGEVQKLIRKNPPAALVEEVNSMAKTIN